MTELLLQSPIWLKYYFLIFIVYSFFGWIIESALRTVLEKGRLINSGSLFGPFIPIYGFGATAILLLESVIGSLPFPFKLLIFSSAATILEYSTSYIIEKIFSVRFWDYSKDPWNINGRVCLLASIFWALLSAIQIVYIQNFVDRFIHRLFQLHSLFMSVLIYFIQRVFICVFQNSY